jgi:hypothetical protein
VFGQCPSDVELRNIYVKTGEQAVISFQISSNNLFPPYDVHIAFDEKVLYRALFLYDQFLRERTDFGSEFIGNARTGNFTIKTASVKKQDGGIYMYMLQLTKNMSDIIIKQCAMLYILGMHTFLSQMLK